MRYLALTVMCLCAVFAVFALITPVDAQSNVMQKIHPWVIEHTLSNQQAEFMVHMKEKPDLSPAYEILDKEGRVRFVYETLLNAANHSQAELRKWLEERHINYQWFYTTNALLVKGDWNLVLEIAQRDDVEHIYGNPVIHNILPKPEINAVNSPTAVEWNVTKIQAPSVWSLGYRGQGVVVGAMDTGYRWTHTALKNQYRGWNGTTADHNYNWHDSIHSGGGSCGANSTQPCDDHGHGTHTCGTVLGSNYTSDCTTAPTNQVGVAPCAKWIGCRNMNQGAGTPASYIECFDFFLAPYPIGGDPSQGDPSKAPDLTTNSWSCPTSEGCSWNQLQASVDAHTAAGIMHVAAAQNSGTACNSVDDPPGTYLNAYTVGSTTSSDAMSSFSSRGYADNTGLMKPDVVAPGSNIRSSARTSDTSYTTMSGTSMATPCTAGGIALLWSCVPGLKNDIAATRTVLNATANRLTSIVESCGGNYVNGPNNTWGYGLLRALNACQYCSTVPSAPTGVVATPGNNAVSLSWNSVSGAATYKIYRADDTGCPGTRYVLIGTVSAPTTTYNDTSVTNGTTYAYVIRALNSNSCPSVNSSCVQATPTAGGYPGVIYSNLIVTKSGTNLLLTWQAPGGTCQVTSYGVYRGNLPWTGYSYSSLTCSEASTSYSTSQGTSSYYFLVVSNNSASEGSYGKDSSGTERPVASTPCKTQDLTVCN